MKEQRAAAAASIAASELPPLLLFPADEEDEDDEEDEEEEAEMPLEPAASPEGASVELPEGAERQSTGAMRALSLEAASPASTTPASSA